MCLSRNKKYSPRGEKKVFHYLHRYFLVLVVLLMLSACSSRVGIRRLNPLERFRVLRSNILNSDAPSQRTEQALRLRFLDDDFQRNPEEIIDALAKEYMREKDGSLAIVVAELSFVQASTYEKKKNWEKAAAYYVMTAAFTQHYYYYSKRVPRLHSPVSPTLGLATELYNFSISRLVLLWQNSKRPWAEAWTLKTFGDTFTVRVAMHDDNHRDPAYFSFLEAAYGLKAEGLINQYYLPGLGAPLIGKRQNSPDSKDFDPRRPRPMIAMPLTALLNFEDPDSQGEINQAELLFFDPLYKTTVELDGEEIPLETDLSTTFAFFLSHIRQREEDFARLRNPGMFLDRMGIFMIDPYNPNKIPVLLIHGLWSSPATYIQMVNDLTGIKEIRENFQFWVFQYPTGLPPTFSSSVLRQELAALKAELNPDRSNPALDKMVVVGHSMGGILARTLISSAGDDLFNFYFTKPIDELTLTDEEREHVENVLFFDAQPFIQRVIFIGAPHRGAEFAGRFFVRLGKRMISAPQKIRTRRNQIFQNNREAVRHERHNPVLNATTSVHQLAPNSPHLLAIDQLPINPAVSYHSIIATGNSSEGPGSSDGVVRYESMHLEGAESEKLLPGGHSNLQDPAVIAEVKRILRLHLEEKKKGL